MSSEVHEGVIVHGLRDFRKELRKLEDDGHWRNELKQVHVRVANMVILEAKARASTGQERAAAGTLRASKTEGRASIILGRSSVPFALGAEFGAHHNVRRVVTSREVRKRRYRTEIVGGEFTESGMKVKKKRTRLEDDVRMTRGGYRKGWNQFRFWKGNAYPQTWLDDSGAGYFLWPAIRAKRDEVIDYYMNEVERIARDAFPD